MIGVTREEFDVLIGKLEQVSRKNPRLYNLRLVGLVVLAYAYLALALFGSLALAILMIVMVFYAPATIKLALFGLIAFGGFFGAIAQGLWVRLEPPKGHAITRREAPELFKLLDELRAALNCSPFHHVLIIGDMNAAVVQIPRLGIFGWHRNYLLIGLPMLQALSPEEFKAVLAHEFAHSSRGHGRFGNWLYRVRRTWAQIFEQMSRRRMRFGAFFFKSINWFWPIFNGHVFVRARANEYEADACSVRLAGADAAASALVRVRLSGTLVAEKFWSGVFERVKVEKEPPADVMLTLGQAFKQGPAAEDVSRWLRQSFLIETNNADTHPCLKDRLRAIGRLPAEIEKGDFPATPPPPPARSAAEAFLAGHAEMIARTMSEEWRKTIAKRWSERHAHDLKLVGELADLEKPLTEPPTVALAWEKAHKLAELHGDEAALPALEQVVALEPAHAGANFHLGRHYLKSDDTRGVAYIEAAIASDALLTPTGCNLLYAYFNRTGQREKLRPLEHRVDEFQKLNLLAQQERARVTATDAFAPHGLTTEHLTALQKIFAAEPTITTVGAARKQVTHFPQSPLYVLSLQVQVSWWKIRRTGAGIALSQRIASQVRLPGRSIVFVNEHKLKTLGSKICRISGAMIYQRAKQ